MSSTFTKVFRFRFDIGSFPLSEDSGTSTTLSSRVSAGEEESSRSNKEEKTDHSSQPTSKFDIMSFFKTSQSSEPSIKKENLSSGDKKVKTHHDNSDFVPPPASSAPATKYSMGKLFSFG